MSLKNIDTDNLTRRWETIIDDYLGRLAQFKKDLIKINKIRNELLLIREELVSRNIRVDDMEENAGGSTSS